MLGELVRRAEADAGQIYLWRQELCGRSDSALGCSAHACYDCRAARKAGGLT
jgi:hypothetical protein